MSQETPRRLLEIVVEESTDGSGYLSGRVLFRGKEINRFQAAFNEFPLIERLRKILYVKGWWFDRLSRFTSEELEEHLHLRVPPEYAEGVRELAQQR